MKTDLIGRLWRGFKERLLAEEYKMLRHEAMDRRIMQDRAYRDRRAQLEMQYAMIKRENEYLQKLITDQQMLNPIPPVILKGNMVTDKTRSPIELKRIGFTCERTGKRYEFKSLDELIVAFLDSTPMGDASTRKDEEKTHKLQTTSPAYDEMIAKLEAAKISDTEVKYRRDYTDGIDAAIEIIRAHQPAPVDLEILGLAVENDSRYSPIDMETFRGTNSYQRSVSRAKAVIQALGREV